LDGTIDENQQREDIDKEDEMLTTLPKNRMLTLNEAAEYLQRSPDTLRQQAGKGVLRAEKRGRDWLVSPIEVERYAATHRRYRITK
jgi:excisionase family DNA binding protein